MSYLIEEHKHRFSAWAASRASSVKDCRIKVADGKDILEAIGLNAIAATPENLPPATRIDAAHREWRESMIAAADRHSLKFTHGIAAKLINVYLKGMIVCGGHDGHPHATNLHPPIDRLLLNALYANNVGGLHDTWNTARQHAWSKFNSNQYEDVIAAIRQSMAGDPLWRIETYWRGHQ